MAKPKLPQICSAPNCTTLGKTRRGYCVLHYTRFIRGVDLLKPVQLRNNPIARFWAHVSKTTDCWCWTGPMLKSGYGLMFYQGKYVLAHRYSYLLAHGNWPVPMALHTCDNPSCVRPEHLVEGTHADNTLDMVSRERQARGERSATAKLTKADVLAILHALRNGETQTSLAKQYGMRQTTISRIKARKIWKHVEFSDEVTDEET